MLCALSLKNFPFCFSNSIEEVNTEFDFQFLGFQALKTGEVCFGAAHEQEASKFVSLKRNTLLCVQFILEDLC